MTAWARRPGGPRTIIQSAAHLTAVIEATDKGAPVIYANSMVFMVHRLPSNFFVASTLHRGRFIPVYHVTGLRYPLRILAWEADLRDALESGVWGERDDAH